MPHSALNINTFFSSSCPSGVSLSIKGLIKVFFFNHTYFYYVHFSPSFLFPVILHITCRSRLWVPFCLPCPLNGLFYMLPGPCLLSSWGVFALYLWGAPYAKCLISMWFKHGLGALKSGIKRWFGLGNKVTGPQGPYGPYLGGQADTKQSTLSGRQTPSTW